MTAKDVAQLCCQLCFGDANGQGAKLKTQVDRWIGAIGIAGKFIGFGLGLLAIVVSVAIALAPSLVESAVVSAMSKTAPGLVDAAVSAALKRHGIAEQDPLVLPSGAIVQAPREPWAFPSAHADEGPRSGPRK